MKEKLNENLKLGNFKHWRQDPVQRSTPDGRKRFILLLLCLVNLTDPRSERKAWRSPAFVSGVLELLAVKLPGLYAALCDKEEQVLYFIAP